MTEALSPSWDRWSTGFWWQGVVGVWLFGQVGWQRDDSWSSVSSSCLQRQYLQNEIRHDFSDKARERLMCYTFLVKSICALCVCVSVSVRLFECLCWSISTMIQKNFSICWRWTECMVNIYIYIFWTLLNQHCPLLAREEIIGNICWMKKMHWSRHEITLQLCPNSYIPTVSKQVLSM